MSYKFTAFEEQSETQSSLPSEAMTFNGKTFENEIPEYRTLQVMGRELIGYDITPLKVGNQDGERIQMKSRPPREITVKYQIDAPNPQRFREIFYQLNSLLAGEDVKFYFNDDTTKYFIGTLDSIGDVPGGSDSIVSEFTILCNDPYAYAMQEDEFQLTAPVEESIDFTIDFKGKIEGDLNSNPNMIMGAEEKEIESRSPDSFWYEWPQSSYIRLLDKDSWGTYFRKTPGNSTRLMVKYDLLRSMERQYPGFWNKMGMTDNNDKINWLIDNLTSFSFYIWSFGIGAAGYGAKIQLWNGTEWVGNEVANHEMDNPNYYKFTKGADLAQYIDSNGYFYAITASGDADDKTVSESGIKETSITMTVNIPAVEDSLTVVNDGPLPVPIRFEVTNHGQNGFIGVANGKEAILIGDPSEIDGGIVEKSERLFTTDHNNSNGLKQWNISNEATINTLNEKPVQSGSFEDPSVINEKRWRLRNAQGDIPTAWGVGDPSGRGWHGPSATAEFNADSKGAKGAINFTARFYVQFLFGSMKQSGLQQCNLIGPDKEFLVGVQMWKDVNGHNGFSIRIGNKGWIYKDNNNARWDNFFGSIEIQRHGNTYTINIQNIEGSGPKTKQTVSYDDPDSAAILCQNVSYWKARWGNVTKHNTVMYNDLYDFWFQKDNVDTYVDIPNAFANGDVVKIDTDNGKVSTSVNNALSLSLQDVGSKPIMAYPGTNSIEFLHSDFADQPDVKAYIRKRYL